MWPKNYATWTLFFLQMGFQISATPLKKCQANIIVEPEETGLKKSVLYIAQDVAGLVNFLSTDKNKLFSARHLFVNCLLT